MRRLIWWVRSWFCTHELVMLGTGVRTSQMWSTHTKQYEIADQRHFVTQQCTKCGWVWRQYQ